MAVSGIKKRLLVASMILFFHASYSLAESPDLEWVRLLKTNSNPGSQSVALDGMGHVYIAGKTLVSLGGPSKGGSDERHQLKLQHA